MQNIIAFSGRKSSGKNTAGNLILGLYMGMTDVVHGACMIDDNGKLLISDLFGDTNHEGIFDPYYDSPDMANFLAEYVSPNVKLYSFADGLKQDVCINLLGLTWKQCYGTDDDKNSLTDLRWENMPGLKESKYAKNKGKMSGREVLQYVGTEIFRKMFGDVWAASTLNRIRKDDSAIAIITDCRFPNEVEYTQKYGGKVVRLTRNQNIKETHASETALDKENFDWAKFDAIVDNDKLAVKEASDEIEKLLVEWGWINKEEMRAAAQSNSRQTKFQARP